MDLSIIVISYNTASITRRCLETVAESIQHDPAMKAEIIVLDNDSHDGSVEMLKDVKNELEALPNITMKIIESDTNIGFGAGNNVAVTHASSSYLLFLNSDTEAIGPAIPDILMQYKKHSFDFAGGKLFNKDGSVQPSAGRFYSLPVSFAALFLWADKWHFSRRSPRTVSQVDWVSGACFITTKDAYQKIHGFDADIFLYWEEVDLFYRARMAGMTVGFFPTSRFIHLEGASSKSRTGPILKVYEGYLTFYKKHHSPLQMRMIQYMLQLKALAGMGIGSITKNAYLTETYSKAYEIATKNRRTST